MASATPKLTLKAGKEKSLYRRHPWIYDTAIATAEGRLSSGATVAIHAHDGRFLAKAAYSPSSKIRARVWTFDEAQPIDHAFFKRRIAQAFAVRRQWVQGSNAIRQVFGEADGLPGLIVDQYADQLVCQFTAAGVEHWKDAILAALIKESGCANVYERSDAAVREREGLALTTGVLTGAEPPADLFITENGVRYAVDVPHGHKTGFYIDQRDNRALVQSVAKDRDVLNCFCYTGGFSLAALGGGAKSVVSIDSAGPALKIAERNMALNGFDPALATWLDADVFKTLRAFRAEGRQFDLIVLDPPKFAPSAHHLDKAARAYKEINLLGCQLLRPGGLLFTYSCSGAMDMDLFQKVVSGAASDASYQAGAKAEMDMRIMKRLSAGADHPQLASFPEGEYLKGLMLQRSA